MIVDIPRFKCYVDGDYLSNDIDGSFVEAYCFALTLIESRPLFFTVHTIDGAVYSRIPILAIRQVYNHDEYECPTSKEYQMKDLDQWGAISSNAQCIKHEYLKDYSVDCFHLKEKGMYWCTIDYEGEDFSQDPEQMKTTNIIFLDNGFVAALPNNHIRFYDRHFTKDKVEFPYRRGQEYYTLD